MRKFTIVAFIFCCVWIGYRVVSGVKPTANAIQPALAQPVVRSEQSTPTNVGNALPGAKPTVALLFRAPTTVVATPALGPDQAPTRTLRPTAQALTTPTALPNLLRPAYPEMLIYDDEINANWSVDQSKDTEVNLWDNTLWFQRFEPTQERTSGATSSGFSTGNRAGTAGCARCSRQVAQGQASRRSRGE
jgi:hypothetical protein